MNGRQPMSSGGLGGGILGAEVPNTLIDSHGKREHSKTNMTKNSLTLPKTNIAPENRHPQ